MKQLRSIPTITIAALIAGAGSASADPVTADRLVNAGSAEEAANWLTVHRTYDSHRFSPLDEINAGNVAGLKLAFAVPLGGTEPSAFGPGSFQGTPLVADGKMYVSDGWGTPYKIDVTSGSRGEIEWICDTGIDKDPSFGNLIANRGLALSGDLVVTNLLDGRVIACNAESGEIVWEQQVATEPGEGFSGAPVAVGDKIIVGQSLGDWATRGWIAALNAETGDEIWRFHTVPAPGEPGSETWLCEESGNPDCWKTGGAAAWNAGSYDVTTDTLIWGTGNPVPMFDPEYRPGDNLYSNSTIALDAQTGELKWHFQYTPGDYLDYDEVGTQLLLDTTVNGEERKIVGHYGRNGFFYQLDRTNGSFISANQYIEQVNWTEGIDPKTGKPINYDPNKSLQVYSEEILVRRGGGKISACPHLQGGVNFWPVGYNPNTGMAYGHSLEGCSFMEAIPVAPEDVTPGSIFLGGAYTNSGPQGGSIVAVDVTTGKIANKVLRDHAAYAGVMLTPDLVWVGEVDGTFGAYDATTLEQKWSINVGSVFAAPAISYAANGKQFVAIVGGPLGLAGGGKPELSLTQPANMLYVFSL